MGKYKTIIIGVMALLLVLVVLCIALLHTPGAASQMHGLTQEHAAETTSQPTPVFPQITTQAPAPVRSPVPIIQDAALAQARRKFPNMSEDEIKVALSQHLNLQMISEERVPAIRQEITSLVVAMQQFRETYGAYPIGSNADITGQLMGSNPKKIVFYEPSGKYIGPSGEVLDPWGTPVRIEIIGGQVEVRSAGPDRIVGDADDQVVKK